MWHNVLSVSDVKVRYNPQSQVLALKCARLVPIKLTVLSDSSIITVQLSRSAQVSQAFIPPQTPPLQRESPEEVEKVAKPHP